MSLPQPGGRRRGRCRSGSATRAGTEAARAALGPQAPLEGLVFCWPDGSPLRPQQVLVTLRHTAATIMISSGVPPAVVSKTLRHSTLSTTVNLYGHLLPHAARDAVRALGRALERADRDHGPTGAVQAA
ncbi:tyrosine-type recombinase/integrase [Streptomyces taklimakanensis]|uniref:tyrosine-type recombinase/integrase n=1 Tax=Streptomyces taklimakanensis TaxID=2569853 RepID=UPI0030845BAB